MTLSVALLLPWASGVLLVVLDGRRRAVGLLAVAVLAGTLALLGVLTAGVPNESCSDLGRSRGFCP